jgi:t-SNARE complex subunit (syntaxin)
MFIVLHLEILVIISVCYSSGSFNFVENLDSSVNICLYYTFSKSLAHDEEMRKLYEEMELQINAEKQRILNEVNKTKTRGIRLIIEYLNE